MSNDLKKTIKINPEIFNFGGKTKKNKERKQNPTNIPLISPNILKNKLLKRIKEHKTREITDTPPPENVSYKPSEIKYNNEFTDSIEYLQILSNNKKKEEAQKQKQQYKDDLYKKTLRNNFSINTEKLNNPYVEIELPDELKQNYYNNVDNSINTQPIQLKYNVDNVIPYGCLKGGFKKTYRNYNSITPTLNVPNVNNNLNERETKLNKLRERILSKQPNCTPSTNINLISSPLNTQDKPQQPILQQQVSTLPIPQQTISHQQIIPKCDVPSVTSTNYIKPQKTKPIIKQTTLRKYVLGKSSNKRTVSILIKDKNTHKKILNAQREIKKKDLPSIKKYLHSHNLIMVGSNAPTDVIRKIYESAMLAGEITNNNKDIMLHNLMKP
jgi:hypothetical protein